MRKTLLTNKRLVAGVVLLCLGIVYVAYRFINPPTPDWILGQTERGDVQEIVAVSGYVEAKNTAELAFPSTGVVTDVFVEEGQTVTAGEVLATLASEQLVAERNEATAALSAALADYNATVSGPSESERIVTDQTVQNAKDSLERTIVLEDTKVKNALQALRSNDLEAMPEDPEEPGTAPTISGAYTCDEEGSYIIEVYNSSADSGYSYRYTGLESGSDAAYTDHAAPLGTCGLTIQFTDGDQYRNSQWTVTVPNQQSSTYVTYKNAYDLALEARNTAIAAAKDAVALAEKKAGAANATPRVETINRSQAAISQARARVAAIDARIADRSVIAPFDGVVTDVSIVSGETASSIPVITVLASDAFELKARIPEIDITKIETGQPTEVIFDAKTDEQLTGSIEYISPLATEIDGVAYFTARIGLNNTPSWLRSGLNADINIIIKESADTVRLPKRFITTEDSQQFVLLPKGSKTNRERVETGLEGNDGYIEITNLAAGVTVVAP